MPAKVELAIYDLSRGMARMMSQAIIGKQVDGIWHTGIIVFGWEFYFGGGLQRQRHEDFKRMHGWTAADQILNLGETHVTEEVFHDWFQGQAQRFSVASYDLMKWNCNNFTNEAAMFLLGKGIPDYIINLPNEVLSSPMGAQLRPMLEGMTTAMNGADPLGGSSSHTGPIAPGDPYAFSSHATAGSASTGGSSGSSFAGAWQRNGYASAAAAAAAAPPVPAATDTVKPAAPAGFPVLERHTKHLISAGASAVPNNVAKLQALHAAGRLDAADLAVLEEAATAAAAGTLTPVPSGSFPVFLKLLHPGHQELQFTLLCLLRLLVLHRAAGRSEMVEATVTAGYVCCKLAETGGGTGGVPTPFFSGQNLTMALCTAANLFGTSWGSELMMSETVRSGCVEAALRGLGNTRSDVRQLAAALLHNYSIAMAAAAVGSGSNGGSGGPASEPSDEATQLLFGCLEGLGNEKDEMVALRRLLTVGRLVRALNMGSVVKEVGLDEEVRLAMAALPNRSEAWSAAEEVLRLLQAA